MQTVTPTSNRKRRGPTEFTLPADACPRRSLHREKLGDTLVECAKPERARGCSTPSWRWGLGAAATGCARGQTGKQALADAAEEAPLQLTRRTIRMTEASPDAEDAALGADADAGDDSVDAGGDHWVPHPPVIA